MAAGLEERHRRPCCLKMAVRLCGREFGLQGLNEVKAVKATKGTGLKMDTFHSGVWP